MKYQKRVLVTSEAEVIIKKLKAQIGGELMFHQSGGCCDGSAPMCFEKGDFLLSNSDVFLGEIAGCGFFMSASQFEYWKHCELTIDVVQGRGSSFSLEIPLGVRFHTRSRIFREEELKNLCPVVNGEEYLTGFQD
ncbi:DUF779 domain-containing protein [Algoriphagus sediminis]|uniref:DUF779 domain-containing protein n=1 Tax=Algoriphagus sediminis TaxID=3057113 RepID=A0ABT7YHJ6_9BACT|nr:DUF779 domain-containing protein [Algoriphagus sediminis]MDN3205800.1 DUF779 domain-containing protein [Algoriphagus sediminis]